MSLIASASPWSNGTADSKKKTPTLRKTIKKLAPSTDEDDDETAPVDVSSDEDRTSKVTQLLQQMTSAHIENVGEGLTNFQPLSYPEMDSSAKPSPPPTLPRYPPSSNFAANPPSLEKTGDYRKIYDVPVHLTNKPYYDQATIVKKEDTVLDRLGYIVHLLEEQQNERTENVLEEYILYVLLGTFVIFVVDSFSRGGRYVR